MVGSTTIQTLHITLSPLKFLAWIILRIEQLLAMMRAGVLHGGVEHVKEIAPAERLRVVENHMGYVQSPVVESR